MQRTLACLIASLVLGVAPLWTQGGGAGSIMGGLQPPTQPGTSNAAPSPGTATLRGHVFGADTGQPLRKAQVRIVAGDIRENRMATTDTSGAYEFKDVRAGRYTISASKGSYVNVSYGQQRATDAPKPLEILENQTVERVDLMLPRGGVVTGRIVDEFGEPAPEIQVAAQRYQFFQGQRRLVPAGRQTSTNDIGEFRLFGIPPGQYYLSATWRSTNQMIGPDGPAVDVTAYAPMYFPGTVNAAEAERVTISEGQEIADLVMMLKPMKATRVTGTATSSDGTPMSPAMILVSQSSGVGFVMNTGGQVRPDGTFTINGLAPGDYTLRLQRMGAPGGDPETATATITATGEDIADLHMVGVKPSNAAGRIVVDPAAAQSLPNALVVSAFPAQAGGGLPAPPPPPARVAEDLTFTLKSAPGRMRLGLGGFGGPGPSGWTIRAVRVNGVDVTDAGVEFKPNEDISGLEVEVTNKLTTISGLVSDNRGDPARDYTAIVFAQDREKWTGNSRYQGIGRPDQDGRFKISGLPPGEYYVIAVDYVEPGRWGDPDYLELIRGRATALSLNDGETRTVDLRISAGT
jgi:hypothetical protein